jgi:hypothetical protein
MKHQKVERVKKILTIQFITMVVMAVLLLVVALLISNFWMTVGVMGVLYVLTVPVTGIVFLRVRARALDAAPAKV